MPAITHTATSVREGFINFIEGADCAIAVAHMDNVLGALADLSDPMNIKTDVVFKASDWKRAGCEISINTAGKYLALKGYRIQAGLSGGLIVSYDS